MRTFTHNQRVTIIKRVIVGYQILLTSMFVVGFTRVVFSTAVDQAIIVRVTSDRPGALTFSAELHGARNTQHSNYGTGYFWWEGVQPNGLKVWGIQNRV